MCPALPGGVMLRHAAAEKSGRFVCSCTERCTIRARADARRV